MPTRLNLVQTTDIESDLNNNGLPDPVPDNQLSLEAQILDAFADNPDLASILVTLGQEGYSAD